VAIRRQRNKQMEGSGYVDLCCALPKIVMPNGSDGSFASESIEQSGCTLPKCFQNRTLRPHEDVTFPAKEGASDKGPA
jgi:hypothetical protein